MIATFDTVRLLEEQARILDKHASDLRVSEYVRPMSEIMSATEHSIERSLARRKWLEAQLSHSEKTDIQS